MSLRAGSPSSLYDTKLATYTTEDTFDHVERGFIQISRLPLKTGALGQRRTVNVHLPELHRSGLSPGSPTAGGWVWKSRHGMAALPVFTRNLLRNTERIMTSTHLWAAPLRESLDELALRFSSSIAEDGRCSERILRQHCARRDARLSGDLPAEDVGAIVAGLREIEGEIEAARSC